MNLLQNILFLYLVVIILLLVVIFILIKYLRQKKQLAVEKDKSNITEERINLFLAATSDRETLFNELSIAKPEALSNRFLKEKIKSRLVVRAHDIEKFSYVVKLIDNLPGQIKVIIEQLFLEALTGKPSYYLGGLLSRSIIEISQKRTKNEQRILLEKIINNCEKEYKIEALESTIKYIARYLKRKNRLIAESKRMRLKNEIKILKEEIEVLKQKNN
jgi:hypothetical protein